MDTKNTRMELGAPEFDWYDFIFDKITPVFAVLTVFTVLYFGLVRETNQALEFSGRIVAAEKNGENYKIQAVENERSVIIEFSTEIFDENKKPKIDQIIGNEITVSAIAITTNRCVGYSAKIVDKEDFEKIFGPKIPQYTLDAFWQKKNKQFARIY